MTPDKWSDLAPRIISAAAMVFVGLLCMWFGGWFMRGLVGFVTVLMIWELTRMLAPDASRLAWVAGVIAGAAVMALPAMGWAGSGLAVAICSAAVAVCAPGRWRVGASYALLVVTGAATLVTVRADLGFGWLFWLVMLVIATDVAGYFVGKSLGGAKFWPSVSPKKTWSGTIAGWVGAGSVGLIAGWGSGVWGAVLVLSLVLSFAGQMGDIWESAIKRLSGFKDSSDLIPGHGGVLDRFDALLAASAALLVIALVTGFPKGLL